MILIRQLSSLSFPILIISSLVLSSCGDPKLNRPSSKWYERKLQADLQRPLSHQEWQYATQVCHLFHLKKELLTTVYADQYFPSSLKEKNCAGENFSQELELTLNRDEEKNGYFSFSTSLGASKIHLSPTSALFSVETDQNGELKTFCQMVREQQKNTDDRGTPTKKVMNALLDQGILTQITLNETWSGSLRVKILKSMKDFQGKSYKPFQEITMDILKENQSFFPAGMVIKKTEKTLCPPQSLLGEKELELSFKEK